MFFDEKHNKIVSDTLSEKFRAAAEEDLLPKLREVYGEMLSGVSMYEDYIADDFSSGGFWYYPMTLQYREGYATAWVRYPYTVGSKDFAGSPYAYVGAKPLTFTLVSESDVPERILRALTGRRVSAPKGAVTVRVEMTAEDPLLLVGKYSQSFLDEMALQLTDEIERKMSVRGIAGSNIVLTMVFAPGTYMEHTSDNQTYRRLLMSEGGRSVKDFWIRWRKVDGEGAFSVSSTVDAGSIAFSVGEDVPQKIREKEYRYLTRQDVNQYRFAMGRRNVTEWREIIKRAVKRGDLVRVTEEEKISEGDAEVRRKLTEILGEDTLPYTPSENTPAHAPENEEFERAMRLARALLSSDAEENGKTEAEEPSAGALPEEEELPEETANAAPEKEETPASEETPAEEAPEKRQNVADGATAEPVPAVVETPTFTIEKKRATGDIADPVIPTYVVEDNTVLPHEFEEERRRAAEENARLREEAAALRAEKARLEEAARRVEAEAAERARLAREAETLRNEKAALEAKAQRSALEEEEERNRMRREIKNQMRLEFEARERERAAEEARLALLRARKLEEIRLAEEQKRAEEEKRAEEARRAAEERRVAEARRAEELRRMEDARRAEEKRRAEEAARRAEEARLAEEARRAEEAKLAEEARLAAEAEAKKASYTYSSRMVHLLFRHPVDPNVTETIRDIMIETVHYFGKDDADIAVKASLPSEDAVDLFFVKFPDQEEELLLNIIKVLGKKNLGIAKVILE